MTGYSEYSLLFASLSPVYVGGASDVVAADGATAVAAAAARAAAHGFDWIEPSRLHKVVTNNNAEKFQHLIHGTNWYAMGCRAVEACLRRSSVAVRVLASLAVRVDSATLPLLLLLSPPPMPLQSYRCHPGRCRIRSQLPPAAIATAVVAAARFCSHPPLTPSTAQNNTINDNQTVQRQFRGSSQQSQQRRQSPRFAIIPLAEAVVVIATAMGGVVGGGRHCRCAGRLV